MNEFMHGKLRLCRLVRKHYQQRCKTQNFLHCKILDGGKGKKNCFILSNKAV